MQHSNVHIAGTHICFAGAIWTDRPHLQVLAPVLLLFYHASNVDMRMQAARWLGATKNAILSLQNYYQFKLPSMAALLPTQLPNLMFPHPTQYHSLDDGTICTFKYSSQLHEDKLVFCGTAGNVKICIKFIRRYSKEAGFAPTLRGFDLIPGGWYMVVMDFINDVYHDLEDSLTKASFETEV